MKIKDGCQRPYLSTDGNHIRPDTTRHSWVWKKFEQWSRRRCHNEIVTVLSKGQLAILKMGQLAILNMAAIRTRIVFQQTHLETARNSYARFRLNSSSSFGDAITVKLKDGCRRPYLSTDQKKHFLVDTTKPLGEHLRQVSKKSDQWSRGQCNEKQFADGYRMAHYGISSTYW